MKLTHRQKRILVSLATPVLAISYQLYRVASLKVFRRRAGPILWQKKRQRSPQRILVVRLDTIGDVVLSEPALRAIRQAYPDAQLDVLVGSAGRAVLAGNPCVDRFLVYAAPWHASWRGQRVSWRQEIVQALRMVRELRRNRYDLAVELRGDPRDIALMAVVGAAVKVGSGWRGGGFLLDVDADVDASAHRVDFALGIAAAAGAHLAPSAPRIYLGEAERQAAKAFLPDDGYAHYVALHLGAGFPSKCLPVEKFVEVARALLNQSAGETTRIVVIGGRDEAKLLEEFEALSGASPVNLVGKLNLLQTAAVLEKCALFIGNDSGPMHLAAAVGTPVVTFFGPSEPDKYHPYMVDYRLIERSLACRPCDHVHCSHHANICLTEIPTADIVTAAAELLSQRQRVGERSG